MAGSVIQATGMVEFEDGLRTGILPGDCSALLATVRSPGSMPYPLGMQVGPGGGVVVTWTPVKPNSNLLGSVHQLCLHHSCNVVLGWN